MNAFLLKAALLIISFLGMSEWIRNICKVNRFLAPGVAASAIILVLNAAGMLGALAMGAYFLYALGLAYWAYDLIARKYRPDILTAAFTVALSVILGAYLLGKYCVQVDDLAHWTLAADSLLRRDAFPNASEPMIIYQSYPMGATVFIYYVARLLGTHESIGLIAQNFLCGILLYSMFAHVKGRKRLAVPATALFAAHLFLADRMLQCLRVDWLLSYYAICVFSTILYYRTEPEKALKTALPEMMALTLVKNSGLFFAVAGSVMLTAIIRKSGAGRRKRAGMTAAAVGAPIGIFALWELHVKLSFAQGTMSRHAVSIEAYTQALSGKTMKAIVKTALRMVLRWLRPGYSELLVYAIVVFWVAFVWLCARRCPEAKAQTAGLKKALWFSLAMLASWVAMIFGMYVFSMPAARMEGLSSYNRYLLTGVLTMLGILAVTLIRFISDPRIAVSGAMKAMFAIVSMVCILSLPLSSQYRAECARWERWEAEYVPERLRTIRIREAAEFSQDEKYVVYYGEDKGRTLVWRVYGLRYDLCVPTVEVLALGEDGAFNYSAIEFAEVEVSNEDVDVETYLEQKMDEGYTLALFEESEELDALLEEERFQALQVMRVSEIE